MNRIYHSSTVFLQVDPSNSDVIVLRITRFLQVLRVLRMDRQRGDLRTMGNVVIRHKKELITCYFVGFLILFAGAYIVLYECIFLNRALYMGKLYANYITKEYTQKNYFISL